jgi:selenocysteine lyase/cysteine desulfurase
MQRRDFLMTAGLALGGAAIAPKPAGGFAGDPDDWSSVRNQFDLSRDQIHMALFFLAPHPRPVREAIERHRRGFDADPHGYFVNSVREIVPERAVVASEYLGVSPGEIAFTDSTTMGLGLVYNGLKLRPGQEILTTYHDHYSTETSLRFRAERTGAAVRRVRLYETGADTSVEGVVDAVLKAITPQTRILAVTWVHSSTGVKLPIRAIADALVRVNDRRRDEDRVLLCVDGVHGLASASETMPELGCDFFIAGTHKWLYGPRGTGLVWGRPDAWAAVEPTIPPFDWDSYRMWMGDIEPVVIPAGRTMTPGGFHSFEHRWAVIEAFRFHQQIGRKRVTARIQALNRQLKEGLAQMGAVTVHTPGSPDLSAGIVCFDVDGYTAEQIVEALHARHISASVTPYAVKHVRLAPCIVNTPDEVEDCLRAVRSLS